MGYRMFERFEALVTSSGARLELVLTWNDPVSASRELQHRLDPSHYLVRQ